MHRTIPENSQLNWALLGVFVIAVLIALPMKVLPRDTNDVFYFATPSNQCSITPTFSSRLGYVACKFQTTLRDSTLIIKVASIW